MQERDSPISNSPSLEASSPPSSPAPSDVAGGDPMETTTTTATTATATSSARSHPKKKRGSKKRKSSGLDASAHSHHPPSTSNSHSNNTNPTSTLSHHSMDNMGTADDIDHHNTSSSTNNTTMDTSAVIRKNKKPKHRRKESKEGKSVSNSTTEGGDGRKKGRKHSRGSSSRPSSSGGGGGGTSGNSHHDREGLSADQLVVNEQMRKALEEDQYSANGSIVDTDSDEEDSYLYRGDAIRMDRPALLTAMRKHLWMERSLHNAATAAAAATIDDNQNHHLGDDDSHAEVEKAVAAAAAAVAVAGGGRRKRKKSKNKDHPMDGSSNMDNTNNSSSNGLDGLHDATSGVDTLEEEDRDGSSIFGQTTGSSNSTWVECDKCKKWRRLRGVVDERKLPPKWYCSMNKTDPERARCSAPEEEYETSHTPESAADARSRKHLRIWYRRLQCIEAYEARQPTLTRGRKRATATTSKDPYEWVRCCNPSCGKWRAILRIMDAKSNVLENNRSTTDGEWYCVMNTWDEKIASCAAPQENLPAIGCPTWVTQDEKKE